MIRTKDLMQGNIIDKGIVFQICMKEGIQGVYVLESEVSSVPKWYPEKDISPIELTEEWLDKLEWQCRGNFFSKTWGRNGVEIITFSDYYQKYQLQLGKGRNKVLEYVHSIQNLFYELSNGEELTITKQK